MKRYLTILIALLVAITIAAPAMAAVEFKWGGQFYVRWTSADNIQDGSGGSGRDSTNDHDNFADQRLRLYFTAQASENLKVVVRWEMGDIAWGESQGATQRGGAIGADARNVELKSCYIDFAIPNTPTRAILGIQPINLLDDWIVSDDYSAALLVTKVDPFKVTVGYLAGQNARDFTAPLQGSGVFSREDENIDIWTAYVDYASGPFKASLIGVYQYGHETPATFLPQVLNSPMTATSFAPATAATQNFPFNFFGRSLRQVKDNHFFDLGFNFTYKVDYLKAYVNFVKNLGEVDTRINNGAFIANQADPQTADFHTHSYTGWMVDAGVTYYCSPWTATLTGFYTTGQKMKPDEEFNVAKGLPPGFKTLDVRGDFDWFMSPMGGTRHYSEIMGGGILDSSAFPGSFGIALPFQTSGVDGTNFYRGYQSTTNLWTVSLQGTYQVLDKTKLSLSYWYFGASEKVMSKADLLGGLLVGQKFSRDVGHEIDLYVTQGVVDGLTLDLIAAYMFTGDAFANSWNGRGVVDAAGANFDKDDAWKLGARFLWNF